MTAKVTAIVLLFAVSLGFAAGGNRTPGGKWKNNVVLDRPDESKTMFRPLHVPDPLRLSSVGNPTTITGFWDFQTNGGACEMIRVNPASGNIHVIMMIADDSTQQSPSRGTAYAMSTDNGASWNNFGNMRVPDRRSGYPFLDEGRGPIEGATIIANHSVISGSILQSTIFLDFPEGSGSFSEIPPPPLIESSGADEPVWPAMACALDGSVTMAPSRQTAVTTQITRTADFVSWSPWLQFPGSDQGSARDVAVSSGTGRVAVFENATGLNMVESTNDGASWPSSPFVVFPPTFPVGPDSFTIGFSDDAVYNGDNILVAIEAIGVLTATDEAQILFWSAATGTRVAVPHDTSLFISALNLPQTDHSTLGYPVIGMSGTDIVIVFQAFQRNLSATGYNYSDLWWTKSTDGGVSWKPPLNITNTPNFDERYPSISKWNPPGTANIVWQEDTEPGANIPTVIEGPLTRASQKFLRLDITTGVGYDSRLPGIFTLGQNYPNPFNPSTSIDYTVAQSGHVTIRVYDLLGKEVATIVNEAKQPGSYRATFAGSSLPSGVYLYQMKAGSYTESRKMVILK